MFAKILAKFHAYKSSIDGATAIEYGLIAGGISLAIVAAVFAFGDDLELMFNTIGDILWQGRALGRIASQPALTPAGVFVPSEDQSLYALNRANGRDRWIYRAETPLRTSPVALGTSLYIYTDNQGLLSIDPLNGAKLWSVASRAWA